MRMLITILLTCLIISCKNKTQDPSNTFSFPDLGVVSVENGWKRSAIGARNDFIGTSWTKENIECADHNGDGSIDYIRINSPPNSYNHYVLVDSDYDGAFDKELGSPSNALANGTIPVPKLSDE